MDVLAELRASISRTCEIPVDSVHAESDLEELGVDSLASAEIVTDLEIRLGRDHPVDVLRRLGSARTVGDVATAMQATFDQAGDGSGR
jgi:acyl carrier protein